MMKPGLVESISSEETVHQQLHILRKQLDSLINALPDAILMKDGAGCWVVANEPAIRLFQLDGVDWHGKTDQELASLLPARSHIFEKCRLDDEAAWAAGDLTISEERLFGTPGFPCYCEMRRAPMFKNNGERKGMVIISRDITLPKLNERDLRIANTAIESQEAIIITDTHNRILRVNSAFTRMTGFNPEEVIGKTTALLKSGRHDKTFYRKMWGILKRDKFWQGEVWDRRKNGQIYPKWLTIKAVTDPDGQINHYVGAFTDLSEHKEAEQAIHRLAFYDPLTDLPNRRLLLDRLEQALNSSARTGHYSAILLIDLDHFKVINDTKGHAIGDLLLLEMAKRLKSCVRHEDTVARLGGDEFVIMLETLGTDESQAAATADKIGEKILESVTQPCLLAGYEYHGSLSIGISLFMGHESSSDEIIKHADAAMYQAKNSGRSTLRFFDPHMQAALELRLTMESELRHALPDNQLKLYYQVQVDTSNRLLGAEALLRWDHPQRGLISPDRFIPMAEDSGLILPIGDWVLRTACLQLKAWEHHPLTQNLMVAVNVSARQFRQPDFVERVCKVLEDTGANASRLKLELTESLVLHSVHETIERMEELKLLGIRFSMDDFGTGYSSLSYLKRLPLSQLKIDQSFVRDIATDAGNAVIVQTIIGMANSLGLNVIAEGVETEEQRAHLERYGCPAYQGYLFGKPVPIEEFERMVMQGNYHNPSMPPGS